MKPANNAKSEPAVEMPPANTEQNARIRIMKIDLSGKRAIVTGSTAGIGLAVAKALAAVGAEVKVTGRRQKTVDFAMTLIRDGVEGAAAS